MFDQEKYLNLLCSIAPKPIESEEQYDYYLKLVEPFFPGDNCAPEETAIYSILCLLIEQYEEGQFDIPELEPLDYLLHLMDASNLKQKDLVGILGSKGVVSEVINGKREITKAQAKKLGERFGVSYKYFL